MYYDLWSFLHKIYVFWPKMVCKLWTDILWNFFNWIRWQLLGQRLQLSPLFLLWIWQHSGASSLQYLHIWNTIFSLERRNTRPVYCSLLLVVWPTGAINSINLVKPQVRITKSLAYAWPFMTCRILCFESTCELWTFRPKSLTCLIYSTSRLTFIKQC